MPAENSGYMKPPPQKTTVQLRINILKTQPGGNSDHSEGGIQINGGKGDHSVQ